MDEKIQEIFQQTMKDNYITKEEANLWILEGKTENSFVAISEDAPFRYQLFFYKQQARMSEKEWVVFSHEMGHIVGFSELIREQGYQKGKEKIEAYIKEVKEIDALTESERRKAYEKLELERQANRFGESIYKQIKREGLI